MNRLTQRCATAPAVEGVIALSFDERQKSRLLTKTTSGVEVMIFLERGMTLRDGDYLRAEIGFVYRIEAKDELLSLVSCADARDLARAAYHLGNRHARVEIRDSVVAFQADHVLDDMLRSLGFVVTQEMGKFEPEPGAYHRHETRHGDGHAHAHEPEQAREHARVTVANEHERASRHERRDER
jgi:urease accessory protein